MFQDNQGTVYSGERFHMFRPVVFKSTKPFLGQNCAAFYQTICGYPVWLSFAVSVGNVDILNLNYAHPQSLTTTPRPNNFWKMKFLC